MIIQLLKKDKAILLWYKAILSTCRQQYKREKKEPNLPLKPLFYGLNHSYLHPKVLLSDKQ